MFILLSVIFSHYSIYSHLRIVNQTGHSVTIPVEKLVSQYEKFRHPEKAVMESSIKHYSKMTKEELRIYTYLHFGVFDLSHIDWHERLNPGIAIYRIHLKPTKRSSIVTHLILKPNGEYVYKGREGKAERIQ